MFCKNCGNQLNGTENVCPKCGVAIEKENNEQANVQPTPVTSTPEVTPVVPAQEAATVVPTPVQNPVAPNPNAAMPTPQQQAPKNNTTLILVIVLVGLLIAGSIAFYAISNKNSSSNDDTTIADKDKDNDNDTPVDPVSSKDENTISYSGYTFTIPDGYMTNITSEYGLAFGISDNIAYSIKVDFQHSYDEYLTMLKQKYPSQANSLEKTAGGRKYIAVAYYDITQNNAVQYTQYATEATSGAVFTGIVAREDLKGATLDDFKVLTKVLDSATSSSSFSADDKEDAGENGIVDYVEKQGTDIFSKLK